MANHLFYCTHHGAFFASQKTGLFGGSVLPEDADAQRFCKAKSQPSPRSDRFAPLQSLARPRAGAILLRKIAVNPSCAEAVNVRDNFATAETIKIVR
jgi:hypothetical protein